MGPEIRLLLLRALRPREVPPVALVMICILMAVCGLLLGLALPSGSSQAAKIACLEHDLAGAQRWHTEAVRQLKTQASRHAAEVLLLVSQLDTLKAASGTAAQLISQAGDVLAGRAARNDEEE